LIVISHDGWCLLVTEAGNPRWSHYKPVQSYCFVCVLVDLRFIQRCVLSKTGLFCTKYFEESDCEWFKKEHVWCSFAVAQSRKTVLCGPRNTSFKITVICPKIRTPYVESKEQSLCCWLFGGPGTSTVLTIELGFVQEGNKSSGLTQFSFVSLRSGWNTHQFHEWGKPLWHGRALKMFVLC
jgi:hypothetical protein